MVKLMAVINWLFGIIQRNIFIILLGYVDCKQLSLNLWTIKFLKSLELGMHFELKYAKKIRCS